VSIEHQRRVLRALGLLPPEQAEQPEEPGVPSFDGGARETPPLPSDPEADQRADGGADHPAVPLGPGRMVSAADLTRHLAKHCSRLVRRRSKPNFVQATADELAPLHKDGADHGLLFRSEAPHDVVRGSVPTAMREGRVTGGEEYGRPMNVAVGEVVITDCRFIPRDQRQSNDLT
jgi:hypothetical protein